MEDWRGSEFTICESSAAATVVVAVYSTGLHAFVYVGKKVVVALCGGNIDTTVLGRCLERGLAADDRLCRFVVHVSDRPGKFSMHMCEVLLLLSR